MKESRFTESQIAAVLQEGELGLPVAELCRKHGISHATYYVWKSKYSGVQVSELQRLRELEAENAKLKRMYADLALENSAIKEVLKKIKTFFSLFSPSLLLVVCTIGTAPAAPLDINDKPVSSRVEEAKKKTAIILFAEDPVLIDNCAVGCPAGGSNVTLTRKTYTLNNNAQTKFANWVAYRITKNSLGSACPRNWRIDPLLDPNDTLAPSDYKGANSALQVDLGHQAPLASLCGLEGRESLNYLSNIAPQKSALNQGSWKHLEDQERKLINRDDVYAVYSVTGPLYEKFIGKLPGTSKDHTIPSGYWKVIFINDTPAVNHYAAFIFPQDASRQANFCTYQVTVAEIEKRTGLSIWPSLSADIQKYIKSTPGLLPRQMGCSLQR